MNNKMYLKALLIALPILAILFAACGDDEEFNINKGREVFMSDNVSFQIVFPETQDTVLYRDTTSGFTTWVQNDSLHLVGLSIKYDSLTYHEKKHYLSLDMSFKDVYLREDVNGIRELGCSGEASLLFDTIKVGKPNISLKVSPITGSIENNTIRFFSGLLPEEKQPYIVMRSVGKRIN